uniref:Protein disulfide-isomerase A3 n=1 Tax=Ciona savignyi TaxID=51511 RepID=H2ZE70_CIOSA
MMKWGKDFSGKLTFAVANREEIAQMLPESGFPDNHAEVVVVVFDENERKFIMPTKLTADNFKSFLTSYIAGEVEAHIKSEDAPADNSGPVTVVTGKTFDKLVMDENKDVLIEFYAPWCGHCKSLEPKWNELAEKMQENDDVVIAKMDATANDAPAQFQVSGYPTIYWAPKGSKKNPVKYQGGREVSDFVKYVKDNASPKKTEL